MLSIPPVQFQRHVESLKFNWSCSGGLWWPNILIRHNVFSLMYHPSVGEAHQGCRVVQDVLVDVLLKVTYQGFVVNASYKEFPFIRSSHWRSNKHAAIIRVHLSHHRHFRVDILNTNDLKYTDKLTNLTQYLAFTYHIYMKYNDMLRTKL